jgi:hypothetical protein
MRRQLERLARYLAHMERALTPVTHAPLSPPEPTEETTQEWWRRNEIGKFSLAKQIAIFEKLHPVEEPHAPPEEPTEPQP